MKICGLNKTTLLDYPGKVAATVFLDGCNYRCPFCHNGPLVLSPGSEPAIPPEEFTTFLKKRQNILQGICVTGGEPTLHKELPALLEHIRSFGYAIKLDTNGSRPEVLQRLHKEGLIDMVAMDIKSSKENYSKVCGIRYPDLSAIEASVEYLMASGIGYEFRTTVVKELHSRDDFISIGKWIAGAKAYFLQAYKSAPGVITPGFSSFTAEELAQFQQLLLTTIPLVEIRGID
ncbi:MAG: anaerobic ribonucleoside-triphosphate reductase activating protein [Blautia sp.]